MIVGLDISKLKMDACIVTAKGRACKVFANSPRGADQLFTWAKERSTGATPAAAPLIVMEATGTYHTMVAAILHALGARICIANPHRARQFATGMGFLSKTDSADAHALAMYGERADVQEWTPPPESIVELRALVTRFLALGEHIRRETLRLKEQPRVVCWLGVARSLRRSLEWHEAERDAVGRDIEAFYKVEAHAELRADRALVRSIPGVGPQAADHLLCLLRHRKLNSAREAAALAGVVPRHRQSGTSVNGKPRISREGDGRVRAGLFLPTLSACTHDAAFRAHYQGLVARGLPKKAAILAAMHRMIRIAYGVLKHGTPYDPQVCASSVEVA